MHRQDSQSSFEEANEEAAVVVDVDVGSDGVEKGRRQKSRNRRPVQRLLEEVPSRVFLPGWLRSLKNIFFPA